MSDASERTEKPTERHLREVRRKGRLGRSQDLAAWLGIGAAAVMLPAVISTASDKAVTQLFTAASIITDPDQGAALAALRGALSGVLETIAPVLVAVTIAIVAGAAAQGGIRFAPPRLHTDQLDLGKGVKRIVGPEALWQGAKSLGKTVAVGAALLLVVRALLPTLVASGSHSLDQLLGSASAAVAELLAAAVAAGLAIAGLDVMVVIRRNRRQTMMTRREVRDENRSNEGDPLQRQHRRSRALAMSRTRMIAAVGEASVVLLNPTHFAVALRYEPGRSAPRVVAKGQGLVAARIREEAELRRVPMVRDVPLTRALHARVPLGREIPAEFYTIVAQVLTFVAMLRRRGAASGVHDLPGRSGR